MSAIKTAICMLCNNANIHAGMGCRNSAPLCNNTTKILCCYVIAMETAQGNAAFAR